MGYLALFAAVAVLLVLVMRAMKNKMQAEKESVFECVAKSKEPLKVNQIGDELDIPDASVNRYAAELVDEKRIGVMVTQDFVQGRRVRIVQYHALAK